MFAAFVLLVAAAVSAQPKWDQLLVVVNRPPQTLAIHKVVGKDLTLLKTRPLGKTPREVCLSPDGNTAYVSNGEGNTITVVKLNTFAIVTTIADPRIKYPDGGVVSPNGRKLYVGMKSDSAVVIDTKTNTVINEIPLGLTTPRRLVFSLDGKKIYAGCNKTPELAAIDAVTQQVKRIQGTPGSPQRVITHPSGAAFVLCRISGTVFATGDLEKHDKSVEIDVGKAPWGLDMSADGAYLFASSNDDDTISVIDTKTLRVVNLVKTAKDPNGLAFRK